MSLIFENYGLRIPYPANWTLEEQELGTTRIVSLASGGTAQWTLTIQPPVAPMAGVAQALLAGLKETYDGIDVELVEEEVDEVSVVGYEVNFVCLDLTNTAQIRGFETESATYVLLWQAEDSEYKELEGVFESLLVNLVTSAAEQDGEMPAEDSEPTGEESIDD